MKESEASMKLAIDQVLKSLDVINIVKTSQAIKLFKEVVFENHQKVIFERLLNPIVIGNQVRSPYDRDFNDHHEEEEEKRIEYKRENLKRALNGLADNVENPDIIDLNLQKLLMINEPLKKDIFKREDKFESVQQQFWSKLIKFY